jgi:hypothetical protein
MLNAEAARTEERTRQAAEEQRESERRSIEVQKETERRNADAQKKLPAWLRTDSGKAAYRLSQLGLDFKGALECSIDGLIIVRVRISDVEEQRRCAVIYGATVVFSWTID